MIRAVLLVALGVGSLHGTASAVASAEDAVSVYGPGKVQGGAGDTFVLDIATGGTEDIGAFQFTMTYDESALSLVEANPAEHFSDAGNEFCPPPALQPDELTFGCSLIGGDSVEGPTALAQLVFEFDQAMEGMLVLGLEGCLLAGPLGGALPVGGCKGASVIVSAEPPSAPISLSPPVQKIEAQPGSTFTFDATVAGVTELGGFEFDVEYDSTKLTLTGATAGAFFAGGAFVCFFQTPSHDFACAHQGKDQEITGSGVIAHLEFMVKAPFDATTAVALENCALADEQGFDIPISACGTAQVQGSAPDPVGGIGFEPHGPPGGRATDRWPWFAGAVVALVTSAGMAWRLGKVRPGA